MDKGAHFYKCDFQVHTPRDTNWTGDRPTDDAGRAAYATKLVAECRKLGLGAIAITDHHDLSFFPFVRAAAEQETDGTGEALAPEQQVVVFPGMELTSGFAVTAAATTAPPSPTGRKRRTHSLAQTRPTRCGFA